MKASGNLFEISSAIQGEGLLVGERQIFVRFLGCNLSCRFCDTPASKGKDRYCRIERRPGFRDFLRAKNPVGVDKVIEAMDFLKGWGDLHHSVSLTGGEPLLQPDFLGSLARELHRMGWKIYLETNGTLPTHLEGCIDLIDIISMDWKLPSSTGQRDYSREHLGFLRVAKDKGVFVKAVITSETKPIEVERALWMIERTDADIPLVLQPVTPHGSVRKRPSPAFLLQLQSIAKSRLRNVRVIPQTHKLMGQK